VLKLVTHIQGRTQAEGVWVLRIIFGPKRDEVTGSGRNYIMRSFMICTPHPIMFG
jgi:hypothetical protein